MTTTAKNYAVRADRIWVPSSGVGATTTVGNKPLDDTLNSVYGKLFTEEPTTPEEGQLWFDGATLKYRHGSSWETIINAHTPGQVYTGALTSSSEAYDAAAKRILNANSGVPGDIVVVSDDASSPTHAETYIMVGGTSSTTSSAVVTLVTTDSTLEVEYIQSDTPYTPPQGSHLTNHQTASAALEALDTAVVAAEGALQDHIDSATGAHADTAVSSAFDGDPATEAKLTATTVHDAISESIRWAEYTATSGTFSLTSGRLVPVTAGEVRMLTCKITIKGSGYVSCAQETVLLNNGAVDSNASMLTSFYSSQAVSGTGIEADGLTFSVSNGAFAITGTSVPDGSKVVVWF